MRLVVQEGAIAATEVFEEIIAFLANNLRVIAANGTDVNVDLAVGMSAHDMLVPPKLVPCAGVRTIIRRQVVHGSTR